MEESGQLVPVLVEPTSTVDLTEIHVSARSHQATPSPREDVGPSDTMLEGANLCAPGVAESRCLKVTFNPEEESKPSFEKKAASRKTNGLASQQHSSNAPPSKDDVLSVVIEKLTELVNDSEKIQGRRPPSAVCDGSRQAAASEGAEPLYKCPKCPCLFALSAKQLKSKEAVLCECCEKAEKTMEYMAPLGEKQMAKGQQAGYPTRVQHSRVNCELCSHIADGYVDLLYHLLSKHADAKICKCKLCDFFTTVEARIQEHAAIHHAPQVYRCSICPFLTDKVINLQEHMKNHNKDRELLLKCSECGFSCQCEDILRAHMWEHIPSTSKAGTKVRKPHPREIVQTSNLGINANERGSPPVPNPALPTQSTERAHPYIFKCLLCGYLCDRLATLKAHAWRHAGEKGCSYPVVDDDECLKRSLSTTPSQACLTGKAFPLAVLSNIEVAETPKESLPFEGIKSKDGSCKKEVITGHESEMSHECCSGSKYIPEEVTSCRCKGINIPPSSVPHIKELLIQKKLEKQSKKPTEENEVDKAVLAAEQNSYPASREEDKMENPIAPHQNNTLVKMHERYEDVHVPFPCGNYAVTDQAEPEKKSTSKQLKPQVLVVDPGDTQMLIIDPNQPVPEPAAVVEACTEHSSALPEEHLITTDSVFIPPYSSARKSIVSLNRPQSISDISASVPSSKAVFTSVPLSGEATVVSPQYAMNNTECLPSDERIPQQAFEEINTDPLVEIQRCHIEIKTSNRNQDETSGPMKFVPSFGEQLTPSEVRQSTHLSYQGQDFTRSTSESQETPTDSLMTGLGGSDPLDMRVIEKSEVITPKVCSTRSSKDFPARSLVCESQQMPCKKSIHGITEEIIMQSKQNEGSVVNCSNSDTEEGSLQITKQCDRILKKQTNYNTGLEPTITGQKRGADRTDIELFTRAKRTCPCDENSNTERLICHPIIKHRISTRSTNEEQARPIGKLETGLEIKEKPMDMNSDEDSIVRFFMNVTTGFDKPFQCKLCSKSFETYKFLKQHLNVHLVHNSFRCPLCKKCFESLENLKLHILEHYTELHRCSECSATFHTKSDLQAHRQSHTVPREFNCEKCSTRTPTQAEYISHCEAVHSDLGKPPVMCSHCGESFSNTNLLLQHTLSCPVRKMRSCKDCGFASETVEGLEEHVKGCHQKPKLYTCDLCDYKTSAKNGIKNHMKFHAKDRPYKCQQCSFTGAYPQSLRSHMRMHAQPDWRPDCSPSELPEQYRCHLCCYTCNFLPSLKSHMWRHASDPNYSYKGDQSISTDVATTSASDTSVDPPVVTSPHQSPHSPARSSPVLQGPQQRAGFTSSQPVTFCCRECGFQSVDRLRLVEHLKTHLDQEAERKQSQKAAKQKREEDQ
ncbi:uncharacterized protein LOC110975669 isoform X2 [Acanthaster planci]|uniref:Uncharacterized protein LOC110975669 isoform X2 n=1 Tax=Acanthaster planci TaxID=133434 RepID=A0A8B7XVJ1_ACAPL|nr:uncharacterized protein LOC110975669 isoform X2 [Acanthaster planci]